MSVSDMVLIGVIGVSGVIWCLAWRYLTDW
jgi:hypothetical protein